MLNSQQLYTVDGKTYVNQGSMSGVYGNPMYGTLYPKGNTFKNGDIFANGRYLTPYNGSMGGNGSGYSNSGMYGDPFGTAMSGTKSGTLQPYVNRMTQNASNALYGGLLGYQPQSLIAGDAGGTPQNSTVPQFNMPSSLGQGLNFTGFGNRSWMKGGQ